MVATKRLVTPTGFRVLAAMLRYRDHGIAGLDRKALAECARADKSTVHTLLRGFIDVGWVQAFRSNIPGTSIPRADDIPAHRCGSHSGRAAGHRGRLMTATLTEQAALALMLADDTPDPRPGRPPILLYPSVAAQVLRELEVDRRSYSVVARRCRRSKPWLIAAHHDGRL